MDLQEVGWGVDWIDLTQDKDRGVAVVNSVMNFLVS
jgi:peptide subunit release factor RF-3